MKTRSSAIGEGQRVSGTLHWKLSKWIIWNWANAMFFEIFAFTMHRYLETRDRGHWKWHQIR